MSITGPHIVYSLRFEAVENSLWAARHAFSLYHQACEPGRAKHYARNWFNSLIVCLFWAKSGKY